MCLAADVLLSWMAERKVINAEVGEGEEDERLGRCDFEAVELVPYDVPGLFSHNDCLSDRMNVANLIFLPMAVRRSGVRLPLSPPVQKTA